MRALPVVALPAAMVLALFSRAPAEDTPERPVRPVWFFRETHASRDWCLQQLQRGKDAHVFEDGTLTILRDGKKVFELAKLHAHTPLVANEKSLYVVELSPIASGAAVAAYDLATGKQSWRRRLEGIGPVAHSEYANLANVAFEGKALVVRGFESGGRYVESLDLETGKQLFHEKLPALVVPEAAKEWRWDDALASLASCAKEALSAPFTFTIEEVGKQTIWDERVLVVDRPGRRAFKLAKLHAETPLVRQDELLIVAEVHPIASGCELVAHDLVTGKVAWRRQLYGLGEICHSKYRNRVNLSLVEGLVVVHGNESSGRYVEAVDATTGAPVWHRLVR